jgi:hypothetical protein
MNDVRDLHILNGFSLADLDPEPARVPQHAE